MFGRRILGGSPDSFKLVLGLHTGAVLSPHGPPPIEAFGVLLDREDSAEVVSTSELPDEGDVALETSTVEWTSDDPDAVVVSKLKNAATRTSGILEERVSLRHQEITLACMHSVMLQMLPVVKSLHGSMQPHDVIWLSQYTLFPANDGEGMHVPRICLLTT